MPDLPEEVFYFRLLYLRQIKFILQFDFFCIRSILKQQEIFQYEKSGK